MTTTTYRIEIALANITDATFIALYTDKGLDFNTLTEAVYELRGVCNGFAWQIVSSTDGVVLDSTDDVDTVGLLLRREGAEYVYAVRALRSIVGNLAEAVGAGRRAYGR